MRELAIDIETYSSNDLKTCGVYRYVEATKLVEVTDTTVTNNSGMTVYYNINGKNVELAAGDVYTIGQ